MNPKNPAVTRKMLFRVADEVTALKKDLDSQTARMKDISSELYQKISLAEALTFANKFHEGTAGDEQTGMEESERAVELDVAEVEEKRNPGLLESGRQEEERRKKVAADAINFTTVIGVIDSTAVPRFKAMVWKLTYGNIFMTIEEVPKKVLPDGTKLRKLPRERSIFLCKLQGSRRLYAKLMSVCAAFDAMVFDAAIHGVPTSLHDSVHLKRRIDELSVEIVGKKELLKEWARNREALMQEKIAPRLRLWQWHARREKCIYSNLMKFHPTTFGLMANAWVVPGPSSENLVLLQKIPNMNVTLDNASMRKLQLPTHFEVQGSPIKESFQNIVNTYGIPRYKEINPAVFTMLTFPYLYGVVYGDVGHGLLLFCVGLYLVMNPLVKRSKEYENAGQ